MNWFCLAGILKVFPKLSKQFNYTLVSASVNFRFFVFCDNPPKGIMASLKGTINHSKIHIGVVTNHVDLGPALISRSLFLILG